MEKANAPFPTENKVLRTRYAGLLVVAFAGCAPIGAEREDPISVVTDKPTSRRCRQGIANLPWIFTKS